jgi:hypothetical protein
MNQAIVDFITGAGTDYKGRTLGFILAQDDGWLETDHTWVQWVFPLPEPSLFNPNAPIADVETYMTIRKSANIDMAVDRFEQFLQLNKMHRPWWFKQGDHNQLRISRLLRFLDLILHSTDALRACHLRIALRTLTVRYPDGVSDHTLHYWRIPILGREIKTRIEE